MVRNIFYIHVYCFNFNRFECVRPNIFVADIEKSKTPTTLSKNVWMVTSCSDGANTYEPYYERCTTVDPNDYFNSIVPVPVQKITFKNKFCAYCNGVSEYEQMTYWDMEIGCDSSISPTDDDIYDQLVERNCTLNFNINTHRYFSVAPVFVKLRTSF